MTGIIYNPNTNVTDDFSSCMVGYSNQYMLGTRIKIKIKDYINSKNIKIDEINSLILKVGGSNSNMTCINVIDESNNNTKVIYKSNNIYEIDLKNYIKESLTDISLLLNYYDSQKYEEISYDGGKLTKFSKTATNDYLLYLLTDDLLGFDINHFS